MKRNSSRGGVSIFIVIFTTLMVTVVASSFAQIMIKSQQQASTNDLSQSAYDSALAGVEDAKRALIRLRECENAGAAGAACANAIRTNLDTQSCESLQAAGIVTFNSENEVQVGNTPDLNQAYTCVKVQLQTENVVDEIPGNKPTVIPLDSESEFTAVRISWYSKNDFNTIADGITPRPAQPSFFTNSNPVGLPKESSWPVTAPALLRTQFIQFKKGNLDFNEFNAPGTTNARTMFLYPQNSLSPSPPYILEANDARRTVDNQHNAPSTVNCNPSFSFNGAYACQAVIELPNPAGGSPADREAYLQLQTYYHQPLTSYKIEMLNGGAPVMFDNVQPRVDSTGRAADLFRRVRAHVSLRNDGLPLPFPDVTLSVEDGICKNMFITDELNEYNYRSESGCDL